MVLGEFETALGPVDPRDREVGLENLLHADRTRARTAPAVRRREGLVQVDVQDVGADVTRTRDPAKGIHVRAVDIDEPTLLVHRLRDRSDLRLEESERIRIRDHDRRHVVVDLRRHVA